jgi:hypothetical protein
MKDARFRGVGCIARSKFPKSLRHADREISDWMLAQLLKVPGPKRRAGLSS